MENKTNIKNCYAIGNCATKTKQLPKDIGDGCNAAFSIIRLIKKQDIYIDYGSLTK